MKRIFALPYMLIVTIFLLVAMVSCKTIKDIPVEDVLRDVLFHFSHYYQEMRCGCKETVFAAYRELLFGLGEQRKYVDAVGAFTAVIEGVEPTGHLLLRRSDGTLSRYAFKEVEQPMSD